MPKRKNEWTHKRIEKFIQEGRGQGSGGDYKPWLTVQDVPSKGRASRLTGWKSERIHHFFSDHEMRYFYLLDWADNVIDIKEKFPLLDQERTQSIAHETGIAHPYDPKTRVELVLTTDFLITLNNDGKEIDIARTVIPNKKLDTNREIERLELERRYWSELGIDWGIVTDKEIPKVMAKNVEWVHSAYWLEPLNEIDVRGLLEIASMIKERLMKKKSHKLNSILTETDKDMNLESGTSLYLLKHLIARKEILLDMKNKIQVTMPVSQIHDVIMESSFEKENLA